MAIFDYEENVVALQEPLWSSHISKYYVQILLGTKNVSNCLVLVNSFKILGNFLQVLCL